VGVLYISNHRPAPGNALPRGEGNAGHYQAEPVPVDFFTRPGYNDVRQKQRKGRLGRSSVTFNVRAPERAPKLGPITTLNGSFPGAALGSP